MPKVQPDDLIPTDEAARLLGCDVSTIARWVRSGKLTPTIKAPGLRGAMLFSRSDVQSIKASDSDRASA